MQELERQMETMNQQHNLKMQQMQEVSRLCCKRPCRRQQVG